MEVVDVVGSAVPRKALNREATTMDLAELLHPERSPIQDRLALVRPECSNGFDDDGDGRVDLADGGCSGPGDNRERQSARRRCGLGFDLALLLPALRRLTGRGRERRRPS